jgi:hypothetical protein
VDLKARGKGKGILDFLNLIWVLTILGCFEEGSEIAFSIKARNFLTS